jgi:hypothetical protein
MVTQGKGTQIGRHYVVCGALETTPGTFAPIFTIHEGNTSFGKVVYKHEFPAPIPNFATQQEAFDGAADMATKWIAANV